MSNIQPTEPVKDWQLVEDTRPMDWQDRVVITGSVITGVVCILLLIRWPV